MEWQLTPTDMLTAALHYAAKGWPVVPIYSTNQWGDCTCGELSCRGVAKHPRVEHAQRFASTDSELIKKWWADNPSDNIAVASGSRSGLIVLDIDPRHMGDLSLRGLVRANGPLPHTVKAFTGGGGEHYLFRAPPIEVRGRIGMLDGIDVRAEDQLFIVPPSRHRSGKVYRWDESAHPDSTRVADLPYWLLKRIQTKNAPKGRVVGRRLF